MPYIVKSSLDIGGKIIPWNEQESNRLLKEKQRKLDKMKKVKVEEKVEDKITEPIEKEEKETTNIEHNEEIKEENEQKEDSTKFFRSSKRNQRAGER